MNIFPLVAFLPGPTQTITPLRRGHRILVVDDDEAVRHCVRDLLENPSTCEILEAANGPDGLEIACAHHPDLILLDIMMPGMSGIDVCTSLLAHD